MKTMYRTVAVLLSLLCASALFAQAEGGGTTGAEFLLSPPDTRLDAMGGVLDGLGTDLDGALVNPAVVAGIEDVGLQVNFVPLPNEVTHMQATLGIPLLGGMALASAQLFNAGTFTYVNELGQPVDTVSIFDVAAGIGYSRMLWGNLSLGIDVKAIYRSLGESGAFAVAGDVGAAYRFETPHIGQPPKPTTQAQLDREFQRDKGKLDQEKVAKGAQAARAVEEARDEVTSASVQLAAVEQRLAEAGAAEQAADGEDAKITELRAKKAQAAERLAVAQAALAEAEAAQAASATGIDAWYEAELALARARYEAKVADLLWIQMERARLFEVIWNQEKELTEADVNANVDDIVAKTRAYVEERSAALTASDTAAAERDRARIESLRLDIEGNQKQIDDEVGPASAQARTEIEALRAKKAEVEASQTEENKDQVKQQSTQLLAQIVVKERELEALEADPWIRRLRDRISGKEREIAEVETDIALRAEQTRKAVAAVASSAEADIRGFEDLRVSLNRDLKKAKLKRELDTLEARNDRTRQKAQSDYKVKEEALYTLLLSSMYRHEERMFQSRLASVTQDAAARRSALVLELSKARETADDNYAFQQRAFARQISEEEKKIKDAQSAGGTADDSGLKAVKAEAAAKDAEYLDSRKALEERQASFDAEERSRVAAENSAIRYERQKVRLVYLQREEPYLNTSVQLGMRNVGTNIRVGTEGYPPPATASASLGYAVLHVEDHALVLAAQVDLPLYDPEAITPTVGVGAEYAFAEAIFVRFGYAFGATERSFSAGIGLKLALGFTEYGVDYAFRPLPGYGFVHSIGVAIRF